MAKVGGGSFVIVDGAISGGVSVEYFTHTICASLEAIDQLGLIDVCCEIAFNGRQERGGRL